MPRDQQVIFGMAALEPRKKCQGGIPRAQRRRDIEDQEQAALFDFIRLWAKRIPRLEWVFAIPNGFFAGYDSAAKLRAVDMVRQGLTAGVWDVFVPWPVTSDTGGITPGLFIEMKTDTGELSDEQRDFQLVMRRRGYACAVCRSWIEAATAIGEYTHITDAAFWRALGKGK